MPYSLTVFTECDHRKSHSVKSSRIRSFSGPYSVRLRENKDQKNSEYVHFSLSARLLIQGNAFFGLLLRKWQSIAGELIAPIERFTFSYTAH